MDNLDRLSFPVVIFGATYGAIQVVLEALKMMNEARDRVLSETQAHRMLVLWHDWFLLWIGVCMFLLVFSYVAWLLPQSTDDVRIARSCRIVAWFPTATCVCFVVGGLIELTYLWNNLPK